MSLKIEHFLNESAEVMQRSDRREREIVRIAIQASNGAENESVLDDIERDVALVESSGQKVILPIRAANGCGCLAVSCEYGPDVVVLADVVHTVWE
jgi:hypothetical protein